MLASFPAEPGLNANATPKQQNATTARRTEFPILYAASSAMSFPPDCPTSACFHRMRKCCLFPRLCCFGSSSIYILSSSTSSFLHSFYCLPFLILMAVVIGVSNTGKAILDFFSNLNANLENQRLQGMLAIKEKISV